MYTVCVACSFCIVYDKIVHAVVRLYSVALTILFNLSLSSGKLLKHLLMNGQCLDNVGTGQMYSVIYRTSKYQIVVY